MNPKGAPKPSGLKALLTAVVLTTLAAVPVLAAGDALMPATVTATLQAGQTMTVDKTFHLDALPGAADIVFAIDTTGSMGTAITQAKTDAANIVNQVQAQIPGARFALADFKDYLHPVDLRTTPPTTYTCDPPTFIPCNFGQPGDYPYKLDLPLTGGPGAAAAFSAAVNTLSASGGGDNPESNNRVFFEAVNDPALVYAPTAVKFLIVLADNIGHDPTQQSSFSSCPNTIGPDPGRNGTIGEPVLNDDLPTLNVINGLAGANDKLLMISYGTFLNCYKQLVAPTGGVAVASSSAGTLAQVVVDAIKAAAAQIGEAHLEVVGSCALAITFSPASYTNQTAPVDLTFTETITAPTLAGNYTCTVQGVADGTPRGNPEIINITVTPGTPTKLLLEPPDGTNTVGENHTVTATLTDVFGNPIQGVTIRFTVQFAATTAATPPSGSDTTNASGKAFFTFTAALPGDNVITAYADLNNSNSLDPGEPEGNPVNKKWILPVGSALCEIKVTDGGHITAVNGDSANFGGVARSDESGNASGNEEYQDHGPSTPMNVKATDILAITCTPDFKTATVYGTATIDGSGTYMFRIRMSDYNEPGKGYDVYGVLLSNGYNSGDRVLDGGNIQIHKM